MVLRPAGAGCFGICPVGSRLAQVRYNKVMLAGLLPQFARSRERN
jgi:hypothetical protein